MPPRMEQGTAVMVSQGTVIEAEEKAPLVLTSVTEPQSEEVKAVVEQAEVGVENREVA